MNQGQQFQDNRNGNGCDCNKKKSVENHEEIMMQQAPAPMFAPPDYQPPFPSWDRGFQGIRRCLNRNTYIWMRNGNNFWFYPIFIGRQTLAGFQWRRRYGWIYRTINLNNIQTFQCF
jgi:hypothetical protein